MALVRCEGHGPPRATTRQYVGHVPPLGYPETAAICGSQSCDEPGLIWLEAGEQVDYDRGVRVFSVSNSPTKLRVV